MKIVLSGVNLVEGGPLKIFLDVVDEFSKSGHELICLINDRQLFKDKYPNNVKFIEFKYPKKFWLFRVFFEYHHARRLCKKINPDVWFSLHDISPRLPDEVRQFVYCHNPSPFYNLTLRDLRFSKKFSLFSMFYKYLYGINIRKNEGVICQQSWISEKFRVQYGINNVVTCKPVPNLISNIVPDDLSLDSFEPNCGKLTLFYPTLPRTFKNIEILIDAVRYKPNIQERVNFVVTISEEQGCYSRSLIEQAKGLPCFTFTGYLSRDQVDRHYRDCDVVIFPSKLETWGLPITEAISNNKPVIVSDLPYAHETVGNYSSVAFIPVDNPEYLSQLIDKILDGEQAFSKATFNDDEQVIFGWDCLLNDIIEGNNV
ncbi:glycosyltransferase [Vibrio splendidus]|uniref:glycosyltransferase n=1 Tax=Vibrio splendidus TaxID=29497 RepID=UPI00030B01F2|nr:glycosyltransferase [Vibrio splendidus]OEF47204.1 hypothetical protein A150_10450 [Vibrio splendidus 1S-124]